MYSRNGDNFVKPPYFIVSLTKPLHDFILYTDKQKQSQQVMRLLELTHPYYIPPFPRIHENLSNKLSIQPLSFQPFS